jgi:DNA-binding protein YbaB
MIAIRQIHEVNSGAVTIALPANFHAKRVEIIILALDEPDEEVQSLQDLLLAAPILTEEQV